MNNLRSRKFGAVLSLLATLSLFVGAGYGQATTTTSTTTTTTTTTSTADQQPQVLEKFQVTGSYLAPAANSVAIPVISIDNKAIQNSGNTTNVLEILRKTVPQFSGNSNIGSSNANVGSGSTNGGSQLSLRNTATLVLVNGRRMAYAPVGAKGGFQFVDVNLIPVSAIERIEVLADGASAIYGTDAVAGVVNIIMKTDFEGFEIGGRMGVSNNKGYYTERSAYLVGGAGNGKTNVTLSAEWVKEDPIYAYERPYSAVTYGTPTFAGSVNIGANYYFLGAGRNAPTVVGGGQDPAALVAAGVYSGPRTQGAQFTLFNLARYVTQKIQNDRQAVTVAFDHKISDSLSAFGDFLYVNTNTFSQINGQPINVGAIAAGTHGNPFNVAATARNRLVDHPRQYVDDTTAIRAVFGLKGQINEDWSWDSAADYNRITQQYQNPGVINNNHLIAAVNADAFNMFALTQAQGVVDQYQIAGTATGGFVSGLSNYDFKVRGRLFDLPAGSVDIAIGGEVRQESLSAVADPLSQIDPVTGALGWNGATTLYPFSAGRTVQSIFGEVRIPLLKDAPGAHLLEFTGALRSEAYSDTSNPTVPKVTLRYLPFNDEFALRGTYSKSFSAPTLYTLFGPSSIGFTTPFTLNKFGGGTIANFQTNSKSGSNPNLVPSRSENFTLGTVYSPKAIKGFSVTVDYWHIRQSELVSTIGSTNILQDVENLGPASPYVNSVRFGPVNNATMFTAGTLATAPGQISGRVQDEIYVTDTFVNVAAVNLDGFDVALKYDYNVDSVGRFEFGSNIGIYNHYTVTFLPGDAPFETVGYSTVTNGTLPRWQSYSWVEYSRGPWNAFLGWRHLPKLFDIYDNTQISKFDSFDLSGSYTFGSSARFLSGARLTVGVNNVFNKFGPLDPTVNTDANVDIGTYGSIGRLFYVDLKFKF